MMSEQFLPREKIQDLIDVLIAGGYRCMGPQAKEGAIVYEELTRVEQLPSGIRDIQIPGGYRLEPMEDNRLFAWANGPQALKPMVFAPRETLWRAVRTESGFQVEAVMPDVRPMAVIGVRACDLAALRIQDKVFLQGNYVDPYYQMRRESLFLVAVNCTHPASTCFCASTGDGPRADHGFDLVLTELDEGFLLGEVSARGESVIRTMQLRAASSEEIAEADQLLQNAADSQLRSLPSRNLRDSLFNALHHDRWNDVAARCLACGNCTMVCPTCFCHAEQELPELGGAESVHERLWDSCFSTGHGYIHGMQLRPEKFHRYRQWLTHKLGSWHDQFGSSGCVGCGRCITWCPPGIDITEEVAAICGEEDVTA
jgi:sulfhydrogenase subunit beta (sulfur reductase)